MSLLYDARLIENSGIGTTIRGQLRELIHRKYDLKIIGSTEKIARNLPEYSGTVIPFDAPLYSLAEQFKFPSPGKARLHIPHYNAPLRFLRQSSVTVHDLIHLQSDEFKLPAYRLYALLMLSRIARHARCILTVSETTRAHFLRLFPSARSKTFTTLNGIDQTLFRRSPDARVASFRRQYELPESFLVAVGIGKKHKNLDFLLKGLAVLWKEGFPLQLVIAGTSGKIPGYAMEPFRENTVRKNVILLPFLPEAELPVLYSSAAALVMPSRLEGFGLPALEAMACCTPVLASSGGSLLEVCGEGALFFDPYDLESLTSALKRFADSPRLQREIKTRGLKRVKDFTWTRNVDSMLRAYELTSFAP